MLRIAHSIFNADDLLKTVQALFAAPSFDACLFFRSFINDTYQLEAAGRRYYLRVYQAGWRTRSEVEAEMNAIEAVHAAGGAVARPVAARDGGFVAELVAPEALRPAVLFHEARGADLTYGVEEGPFNAYRYGAAVARLHNATSRLGPPAGRKVLDLKAMLETPSRIIASRLTDCTLHSFTQLCSRLRERITDTRDLTLAFCHGDLNSSNIHFAGDRPTTIDFDCCGWGYLASDIAAFARGVTLTRMPGAEATSLISSYLRGYQQDRRIAPADFEALPTFLLTQRIWVSALHLDGHHRWGNIHFGRQYAARLIEWLQAWRVALDQRPDWLE